MRVHRATCNACKGCQAGCAGQRSQGGHVHSAMQTVIHVQGTCVQDCMSCRCLHPAMWCARGVRAPHGV